MKTWLCWCSKTDIKNYWSEGRKPNSSHFLLFQTQDLAELAYIIEDLQAALLGITAGEPVANRFSLKHGPNRWGCFVYLDRRQALLARILLDFIYDTSDWR